MATRSASAAIAPFIELKISKGRAKIKSTHTHTDTHRHTHTDTHRHTQRYSSAIISEYICTKTDAGRHVYELFAALLVVSPFTGTPFWKAATTNEAAANVLCAEWGEKNDGQQVDGIIPAHIIRHYGGTTDLNWLLMRWLYR